MSTEVVYVPDLTPRPKSDAEMLVLVDDDPAFCEQRRRVAMSNKKSTYGLVEQDLIRIWEGQGRRCAICHGDGTYWGLSVDHCHKTGKIRGLLCGGCNIAIGRLLDDPYAAARAAAYLMAADTGFEVPLTSVGRRLE